MKVENIKTAQRIIEKVLYITIATVTKSGTPWNTPVFSAYDKDYNFYWGSYSDSQHSKNLRANSNLFLVIYDSTVPAGTGEGVYVKARGIELEDSEEIAFAHNLLNKRHSVPYWKIKQVKGAGPIRLYKAVPQKFWLNGEGEIRGNYIDKLEGIDLSHNE